MTTPVRDLLLHPVRLRIVQALVGRRMTPLELKDRLGDVAQATLYRHLAQLHAGGLLEVVDERRVRGGVERTYTVVEDAASLDDRELEGATPEDHVRYFAAFLGSLLSDFARCVAVAGRPDVAGDGPDLAGDRVGYRQAPLWLTDEEFDELAADLRQAVAARRDNEPAAGRRRRLVTVIVMPDA